MFSAYNATHNRVSVKWLLFILDTRISVGWHTLGRDHVKNVGEKQITFLINEIDVQFHEEGFVWKKRSAYKKIFNQCVKVYIIYADDQLMDSTTSRNKA